MEYRIHKKTGDKISILGLGTSYIADTPEKDAVEALIYAHENGINYADLATAGARTFGYYGTAFASVRKEMFYQVHFGANYESGEYGWTTKLETIKRQIDWMLTELKTDYIDYGFIHCLDAASDWQAYQKHGVLAPSTQRTTISTETMQTEAPANAWPCTAAAKPKASESLS